MDEYLALAKDLVRQGGQLIKDNLDKQHEIEIKSDLSPVTLVDKQINKLIIEAIKAQYPDHGILGEEESSTTGKEEYLWICDPLDGTQAFTLGVPLSTCILALAHKGELILSVIYNPFKDELYHAAKGKGAFCNDQPIKVNDTPLEQGANILISESGFMFAKSILDAGYHIRPLPGAGYRAILLASGRCSGIMQDKSSRYDIVPAALLVEEAGGKATDLKGNGLPVGKPLNNGVILSNGIAHNDLLKISQHNNQIM